MRTKFLLWVLFFTIPLSAQKNSWFTVEGGLGTNQFHFADNSSKWTAGHSGSWFYGFYLRRELTSIFSLELGYGQLEYGDEYGLSKDFYVYDGGNQTHQIPVRLHIDKTVYRDRITLYAYLGYTMNIESTNWGYSSAISRCNAGDTLAVESASIGDSNINSMIGGSAGIRFRLFDQLTFNLSMGYNYGFADLREATIYYRNALGVMETTHTTTKHQYWYLALNLSYPINRARDLVIELLK